MIPSRSSQGSESARFPENIDGLLEQSARDAAYAQAMSDEASKYLLQEAEKKLLEDGVFQDIKDEIKNVRKPRMRTVEFFLCDSCNVPILDPSEGFVIHGNIYTADTRHNGGLIGNNIPEKEEELESSDSIKKTVLCKQCFFEALDFKKKRFNSSAANKELESMYKKSKRTGVKRKV